MPSARAVEPQGAEAQAAAQRLRRLHARPASAEVAAAIKPSPARRFADVALLQSVPSHGLKNAETLASRPGAAVFGQAVQRLGHAGRARLGPDRLQASRGSRAVIFLEAMTAAVAMLDELGVAPRSRPRARR